MPMQIDEIQDGAPEREGMFSIAIGSPLAFGILAKAARTAKVRLTRGLNPLKLRAMAAICYRFSRPRARYRVKPASRAAFVGGVRS